MTTKQILKFAQFLNDNGAVGRFIRNTEKGLKNTEETQTKVTVNEYLKFTKPNRTINGAFDWEKSPEGWLFWKILHDKWLKKIMK